jgi:NitT/TauT family transport system ATP-binding protein
MEIKNIDFSYPAGMGGGSAVDVFSNFSMSIMESGVSVILGPSGCGKTTLLNLLSGLLSPRKGSIGPEYENISVLFQEPRLLPWKTVRKNIELVLKGRLGEKQARETALHYLELVGLGKYEKFYPDELSGGMRQRVAIARAFAYPAELILMDEPFQALDLGLKVSLTGLFTRLWIEERRTSVFVTHDINEAILLGDEIFVLSKDKPVQIVERIVNEEPHDARSLDSVDRKKAV